MATSSSCGPRKCPKCALLNDSTATACDCGYNFVTGIMLTPRTTQPIQHPADSLETTRVLQAANEYRSLVVLVGLQILFSVGSRIVAVRQGGPDATILALLSIGLALAILVFAVLAAIKGFRLADSMRLSSPVAWALGLFVPCVSLFVLLALSSRAAAFCRRYGLRVGLLGPTRDSIDQFQRGRSRS
jgi:hypothetical protein